jgi:hypothetical protein
VLTVDRYPRSMRCCLIHRGELGFSNAAENRRAFCACRLDLDTGASSIACRKGPTRCRHADAVTLISRAGNPPMASTARYC